MADSVSIRELRFRWANERLPFLGEVTRLFFYKELSMRGKEYDPTDRGFAKGPTNNFYATLKELTGFYAGVDRRSEDRILRSVTVMIQPLDMDFQPDGEPFHTVTRDVSSNGMGFICTDPLLHEYVRIAMPEQTRSTVIARVCYNLSVGIEYPLFLAGVQFVT